MTGNIREIEVMWAALNDDGFEHVRLELGSDGVVADGVIVRRRRGLSYRRRYRIRCDALWRVLTVTLTALEGNDEQLILASDGEGTWRNGSGDPIVTLEGCIDIDIEASPFTNTLAIQRLKLRPQEERDIRVAFIGAQHLGFEVMNQRYSRLSGAVYRYESLDNGFTAELPVDADALLFEYPGYFRRVWASPDVGGVANPL